MIGEFNLNIFIVDYFIGVFAFNEENKLIDVEFFSEYRDKIVETVRNVQKGRIVLELGELLKRLIKNEYDMFIFENSELAKSVREEYNVKVDIVKFSRQGRYLRSNIDEIAVEKGYFKDHDTFNKVLHEVASALTKSEIKESSGKRDLLISQAILVMDDLEKNYNIFVNRLREWYGYFFPELGYLVDNNETYLRLTSTFGLKENFTSEKLLNEGFSAEKIQIMVSAARSSIGAPIRGEDIEEIQSFAKTLQVLQNSKKNLEAYLERIMMEVAPNIKALVGSTIGARLIAVAGGLEGLAKKSSSTVQVLGAEKALFRSLSKGTKPPKHGLIFQYKDVHMSPKWQRGKIARALAGKLVIAARIDFFKGKYMGDSLKNDLEKRVAEIKRKYESRS